MENSIYKKGAVVEPGLRYAPGACVVVGSNPTGPTSTEPATVNDNRLFNFGLWLLRRGNRESTIRRKMRFLKSLRSLFSGDFDAMFREVLKKGWWKTLLE